MAAKIRCDAGRRPQPWHDDARALKAEGLTYSDIADELGLSQTTIAMLFSDRYRERQRASQVRLRAKRDAARRERSVA